MNTPTNYRPCAILSVTLVAALLGGPTSFTALTFLLIGAAMAALFFVPQSPPPRACLGLAVIIVAICASSFLPSSWFNAMPWRVAADSDYTIALGSRLTPQPWITAERLILALGALAWLAYLISCRWTKSQRRMVIHGFMGILTFLAVLHLLLKATGTPWPWGEYEDQFGPFANRNQLGTLCAMSVALHAGCLGAAWRQANIKRLGLTSAGLGIALLALVSIGSRMALGLAGLAFLLTFIVHARRHERAHKTGLAISGTLIALTLILLADTRLTQRLSTNPAQAMEELGAGRGSIYSDVLSMMREAPVLGFGLGNFTNVFPFSRQASVSEFHIRHPESDWLWWWAELGWPVILLGLAGCIWIARNPPRFRRQSNERAHDHGLRLGLMAALLVFVLHSLVDVPAHRPGTLWAGLLVIGLLVNPQSTASMHRFSFIRWAPALVALVAGFCVLTSPTDLTEKAPLAWQGYFARAQATLNRQGPVSHALTDFQRARFLEPHSAQIPLAESDVWLRHAPGFAVQAWHETLRRDPKLSPDHFTRFLRLATKTPGMSWETLRLLAGRDPSLWVIYLRHVPQSAWDTSIQALSQSEALLRNTNSDQHRAIAEIWAARGQLSRLTAFLNQHPSWQSTTSKVIARSHAARGEFKEACQELRITLLDPPIPHVSAPLGQLRVNHLSEPGNPAPLIALIEATIVQRAVTETPPLLKKLEALSPNHTIISRLRFFYHCALEEWETAWQHHQGVPAPPSTPLVQTSR